MHCITDDFPGNLGPMLRGNKLIPLEYQLRGCCCQIFEIMVYTTQNLQIAFQKKLIKQEKEFLCVSFCVPFLHTNNASYCFKMIITQHVVPAAGLEPARPTKPRDFKSLVSTIPPRGHVLGAVNIAIVDAV